ncbi:(d)CMP kinase [Candidatus Pacearchaeota archaeon]|nr:(d)CMP kinase [Candidatus Pacearchaeota archaeon]
MLNRYLDSLQEGYILSDKTISVNLDKFISGESNILLIAGIPASGKSTLGKKLAKKYKAKYIETDIFYNVNDSQAAEDYEPEEEYKKDFVKKYKRSKKRYVIEGVITYWSCFVEGGNYTLNNFIKEYSGIPIIILGPSILKVTLRGYKRERQKNKKLRQIIDWYLVKNVIDNKLLTIFRKAITNMSNSKPKEFKMGL